MGKVNETEESIWAAPDYHVNDGGWGWWWWWVRSGKEAFCFLITLPPHPPDAIMILPFDSLSFPISVPLRRGSGPR